MKVELSDLAEAQVGVIDAWWGLCAALTVAALLQGGAMGCKRRVPISGASSSTPLAPVDASPDLPLDATPKAFVSPVKLSCGSRVGGSGPPPWIPSWCSDDFPTADPGHCHNWIQESDASPPEDVMVAIAERLSDDEYSVTVNSSGEATYRLPGDGGSITCHALLGAERVSALRQAFESANFLDLPPPRDDGMFFTHQPVILLYYAAHGRQRVIVDSLGSDLTDRTARQIEIRALNVLEVPPFEDGPIRPQMTERIRPLGKRR